MNENAADLSVTLVSLDERVERARHARLVLMDRILQLVGKADRDSSCVDAATFAELRRWLEDLSEAERAAVDISVDQEGVLHGEALTGPLVAHLRAQVVGQACHLRILRAEEGRLVELFLKIVSAHVPLGAR